MHVLMDKGIVVRFLICVYKLNKYLAGYFEFHTIRFKLIFEKIFQPILTIWTLWRMLMIIVTYDPRQL